MTPGPDTALTIRNTVAGGRRGGVLTALGVSTGQLCWTLAGSLGVVAVLRASQPAFTAVRFVGAAYLVFLGNPKMAVFFASLLPQFGHSLGALLILGSCFAVMTTAWLSVYSLVVPKLRRPLQRPLDALSGIALVALGSRLARS